MSDRPGPPPDQVPFAAAVEAGVARRDITPPVGIYARCWGAAKQDVAIGIHRPMTATVLAIRSSADEHPLLLAVIDATWWQIAEDERYVRHGVIDALGVDESRVIISLTHTHAGPSLNKADCDKPGGELVAPYLDALRQSLIDASREAVTLLAPSVITWQYGHCDLATNRDLPDSEKPRVICGFNPHIQADDTLLVGRVSNADGDTLATIVNYACHPTTLAWDNELISPDFVGAMREVIEQNTNDAPCLFLQGASGELSPREQYVGDTAIADANGRQLGFAALATLATMLPARHKLTFAGAVESGAPLATWKRESFAPDQTIAANKVDVPLPLKPMPTEQELKQELDQCTDRTIAERLRRKIRVVQMIGSGPTCELPAWLWRIGTCLFVAQPNEAYSQFQIDLRQRFPDHAVVVINLANGSCGYLSPPEKYDQDIYQVWQTPFNREGLSTLFAHCTQHIERMIS